MRRTRSPLGFHVTGNCPSGAHHIANKNKKKGFFNFPNQPQDTEPYSREINFSDVGLQYLKNIVFSAIKAIDNYFYRFYSK